MKDFMDLFNKFLENPDEETAKRLADVCSIGLKAIDHTAAQFGLTDMIDREQLNPMSKIHCTKEEDLA